MADTTEYAWGKPTVSGDLGAWGTILNTTLDDIDTDLKTVDDAAVAAAATADAALPVAGGTCTGRVDFLSQRQKLTALGSISTTQALNLALSLVFTATIASAVTLSFTNVPSGSTYATRVDLWLTGDITDVTWPASVVWAYGIAPLDYGDVHNVRLVTFDAGTTWYAEWLYMGAA